MLHLLLAILAGSVAATGSLLMGWPLWTAAGAYAVALALVATICSSVMNFLEARRLENEDNSRQGRFEPGRGSA